MNKLLIVALALAATVMTIPLGQKVADSLRAGNMTRETRSTVLVKITPMKDQLSSPSAPKQTSTLNILTLESKNTYVFRGPVTGESVGDAIKKIAKMSRNLSKSEVIYLVLDTPGGSIFDGIDFIDFLEGVPQEVRTVTLFAASMGFQIVENNPGKRLITRGGTLMSHRAVVSGLEGQFDGELESRYKMYKRKIDYLEAVDSNRMSIPVDVYKEKIKPELWVHGFDAQEQNVADEVVLLQCGSTMNGEDTIKIRTFFGAVSVVFDSCPLIRDPIRIDMSDVRNDAQNFVSNMISEMFSEKTKFVKDYIVTEKFYKIFP